VRAKVRARVKGVGVEGVWGFGVGDENSLSHYVSLIAQLQPCDGTERDYRQASPTTSTASYLARQSAGLEATHTTHGRTPDNVQLADSSATGQTKQQATA